MSPVALDRVRLAIGRRIVLDETSFALRAGEFVALLGPNGAGKTTLLRAILGLLAPQAGRIEVFGKPAARGNRAIGYVPQARGGDPPNLSGRDVLAVAAGHPFARDRADIARVLRLTEAAEFADAPMASLSGGQRQRLMLAQALLGEPRLLLLDEPLASLDPPAQRTVVDLAARLCRALGATVLFSAHELTPLLGQVDRVLYLGGGRAAIGTAEEVVTSPVLSRLYGAPVEVARVGGRVFVVAGDG